MPQPWLSGARGDTLHSQRGPEPTCAHLNRAREIWEVNMFLGTRILFGVILVLGERSTSTVRFIDRAREGVFDSLPPDLQLEY